MINAVLSAIPTYFLSFFSILKWVEREIDSLRRKFLWKGANTERKSFSVVNWKKVCKRKEFGGLGIINLQVFNMALLLRWWWKLFEEQGRK